MIRDVLAQSANSLWPQISLVIFVLCFVGVFLWTYAGRRDRFRKQASLPLEDEPNTETMNGADRGE